MKLKELIKILSKKRVEWNYLIQHEDFNIYCCFENDEYYDYFILLDFKKKELIFFSKDSKYEKGSYERRKELINRINNSEYANKEVKLKRIYTSSKLHDLHRRINMIKLNI